MALSLSSTKQLLVQNARPSSQQPRRSIAWRTQVAHGRNVSSGIGHGGVHLVSQARRGSLHVTREARVEVGVTRPEPISETELRAKKLVRTVLQEVEGTDGGLDISSEKRKTVDALLEELEEIGKTQTPRPLDNPLLFGNYEVSYVSTGRKQDGAPAGGNFRQGIGRLIFQTRGVYQSVLAPDIVVNKVAFALLGFIRGAVGLRGTVEDYGSGRDTAKVLFEQPSISFGSLHFRIGPESDVVLTTTYLDENVRLGKGSLGSLFVFKRGGTADAAEMDKMGLEKTSPMALATLGLVLAAMGAAGVMLWQTQTIVGRGVAVGIGALLLGMCVVLKRGGLRGNGRSANMLSQRGDLKSST